MSKAKELIESLKSLPEGVLPQQEPPVEPFEESELDGVEITEDEDKEYHVKKEKNAHGDTEHKLYHGDKHIGTAKGALAWKKNKDGKMVGGYNVGSPEHGISVLKKMHKSGKMD